MATASTKTPREIRGNRTIEEFAVAAGVSSTTIRDFENSVQRANVGIATVRGLSRAYGIPASRVVEIFSPAPARREDDPLRGKSL
jgi:transcriptional regulator with XRE-family HTH domain